MKSSYEFAMTKQPCFLNLEAVGGIIVGLEDSWEIFISRLKTAMNIIY